MTFAQQRFATGVAVASTSPYEDEIVVVSNVSSPNPQCRSDRDVRLFFIYGEAGCQLVDRGRTSQQGWGADERELSPQNSSANFASSVITSGDHGGSKTIFGWTPPKSSRSPTSSGICSVTWGPIGHAGGS